MSLEEIYQSFREKGSFSIRNFVDYKKDQDFFERLNGHGLCLHSTVKEGCFVCVELRQDKPSWFQSLVVFFLENGRLQIIEEVLPFFGGCTELPGEPKLTEKQKKSLNSAVEQWVYAELRKLEVRFEQDMKKDAERLNEYFKEMYEELMQKQKALYFHNYYFEKEQQIQDELAHMEREIGCHQDSLLQKYNSQWDCRLVLWGTVSK